MRSQIYSKANFSQQPAFHKNAKFIYKKNYFLTTLSHSSFSAAISQKLSNKSCARNNVLRQCAWRHCEFNSHCKWRVAGILSSQKVYSLSSAVNSQKT
jgi:hypothetical protein